MDREINNEIKVKTNERDNDINEFMKELQSTLDNSQNKSTIDNSLYNEIYNENELAHKYSDKLDKIIKECLLEYSYDTDFFYLNYDKKSKRYYMDYYYGDISRTMLTKKEINDYNYEVGSFYFPINDGEYLQNVDYIVKDRIKEMVSYTLNNLENEKERGKNGK